MDTDIYQVLPASAGMILLYPCSRQELAGAPRIRGDDPAGEEIIQDPTMCSPHPRG